MLTEFGVWAKGPAHRWTLQLVEALGFLVVPPADLDFDNVGEVLERIEGLRH